MASLGLPDRTAFPELVALIAEAAHFETAAMLWLSSDYQPIDTYITVDSGPELVARYATRWFDAEEGRYYPRQKEMQLNPALGVMRVSDYTPRFGETELYDEVYAGARHHWIVGVALRDGARPIGNLGLARPPSARDFDDQDLRMLRLLRPYVVQALARAPDLAAWPDQDLEDDAGMMVVDLDGRVQHATPGAWRLMQGAAGLPVDLDMIQDRTYRWARLHLLELARRALEGVGGKGAGPAVLERTTPYGRFLVRAYALVSGGGCATTIGIQIARRLPASLKMLRSPVFRALTSREQDVARLLLSDLSYPQIGERLGLTASTVVTHVRNLGNKLGANGRHEIVGRLCS